MRMSSSLDLLMVSVPGSVYKGYTTQAKNGIPQGIIEVDSDFAKKINYISKRFFDCSRLRGEGNRIVIQTIECRDRRRGYLRDLFRAIWDLGAEIAVYTPLSTMEQILIHYGFKKTMVKSSAYGKTDVWVK